MKKPIQIAPDDFIFYGDEMMLISTEETTEGKMITFQIPPEHTVCPFGTAIDRHRGPGTRFYAVFIELDDDEEPINQRKRKIVEQDRVPSPVKSVVTDAAIKCKTRQFQRWVYGKLSAMQDEDKKAFIVKTKIPYDIARRGIKGMTNEKIAAEWAKYYIYWVCKVRSRSEIPKKRGALQRYNQGIVIPYDRWVYGQ